MMRIAILGAGSVGCYIGAHLIRAGFDVLLIGRERLRSEIAAHGLRITHASEGFYLRPDQVQVVTDARALRDRDLILVTVKSADTLAAARVIVANTSDDRDKLIVSFQNGVRNAEALADELTGMKILAGMVPWNVIWNDGAHFHRGTEGDLMLQQNGDDSKIIVALLRGAGLAIKSHADMSAVLWGKLLLNLNNPINALSGLPLREQLAQRAYRRILSALMREAIAVLRQAGIRFASVTKLPPNWLPWILDLPDAVFLQIAGSMLKLDPQARSSMWEDLHRGRATEIDFIHGEIMRIAQATGTSAPFNAAIVELMHKVETQPEMARLSAAQLRNSLGM